MRLMSLQCFQKAIFPKKTQILCLTKIVRPVRSNIALFKGYPFYFLVWKENSRIQVISLKKSCRKFPAECCGLYWEVHLQFKKMDCLIINFLPPPCHNQVNLLWVSFLNTNVMAHHGRFGDYFGVFSDYKFPNHQHLFWWFPSHQIIWYHHQISLSLNFNRWMTSIVWNYRYF